MPETGLPWQQQAHAKINLALDVSRKRPDGFHEVSMIMQAISLHDTVSLTLRSSGISLACNRAELPCDGANLAYRAADLLRRECGVRQGIHIQLTKRIPLAAGLAGGSSDAAAVLRGLNELWRLGLKPAELESLAARLGSDVPFCLWGGTVHATGRGEKLEPLPDFSGFGVVLANPPISVSTAWVYGQFQPDSWRGNRDIGPIRRAIDKKDFQTVAENLFNALETVTIPAYHEIGEIKSAMVKAGAKGVLMSGSGPTVFALTPDLNSARQLAGRVSLGPEVSIIVAETVAREEQINGPSIITG